MSSRYPMLLVFLLAVGGSASTVQAEDPPNWRLAMEIDYLAVGNGDSTLMDVRDRCVVHGGLSRCSVSAKSLGAQGVRIKFSNEYAGIKLGPSVGYLNGGPGAGSQIVRWSGLGNRVAIASSANTLRFLEEASKTYPLTKSFSARLGAGLGMAVENLTIHESGSGEGFAQSLSLGWLTWEISPAIVYNSISLGIRYVGFSRGRKVPWNTYGAFIGVDF